MKPERGAGIRVIAAAQRVQRHAAVVEVQADLRAGCEALLNSRVEQRGVGDQRVGSGCDGVGLRCGLVGPVQLSDDGGVVNRNRGADGLRDGALYGGVDLRLAEDVEAERVGGDRTAGGSASGGGGVGGQGAERTAGSGRHFEQRVIQPASRLRRPWCAGVRYRRRAECSAGVRYRGCSRWPGRARPAATGRDSRRG